MRSPKWTSLSLIAISIFFSGCKSETKGFTYMPDMAFTPAIKAQADKPGSMRMPPAGTIARGHKPYPYSTQPEEAGRMLKNPLHRTKAVLEQGRNLFNSYCLVCHGPYGEGDGTVVPKFPRPPSLQSDKIRDYSDGRIFHVITMGQNLMPSYASQVEPEERWAIIHYLRALYRAKHPTAADLKAAETW